MKGKREAARRIRILLLDDHVVIRQGLRLLLDGQADMEVIGETSNLEEALEAKEEPDVIVADLVLPDARGAETVSSLRERFPATPVVVLTMVDNPTDVHLVFAAGAQGYLVKEAAASEVTEAVRTVADGGSYLQASLGAALARWREAPPGRHVSAVDPLTDREHEVLRLIALGHTNAEISGILHLSQRTVEAHRAHILLKLNLRTRAELVRYAIEIGMIDT